MLKGKTSRKAIAAAFFGLALSAVIPGAAAPATAREVIQKTPRTKAVKDPHDLRPQIDQVITAIQKQLATATLENPMIVVFGETHDYDALVLFSQLVIDRFDEVTKGKGINYAAGIEQPHNFIISYFDAMLKDGFAGDIPNPSETLDPAGSKALKMFVDVGYNPLAPAATANSMLYFLQKKIPVGFNDAAKINGFLDLSDPLTQSFAPEHMKGAQIPAGGSAEALSIRNKVLAENIMRHIKRAQVPVYFEIGGEWHLLAKKDGLAGLLRARGANVIPVLLEAPAHPAIPDYIASAAVHPELRNRIEVKQLPTQSFVNPQSDPYLLQDEAAFLRSLCAKSVRGPGCFNESAIGTPSREELTNNLMVLLGDVQTHAGIQKRSLKP